MLNCETNTPAMGRRVERAAASALGLTPGRFTVDFEHGQWWVTDLHNGQQWSVADGPGDQFDFEQVTPPLE